MADPSNGTTSESLRNPSPEMMITLVAVSCIVPIGLAGNILSVIVLNRKRFKNNITSIFLIALAISDCVVLLTNVQTIYWIEYNFGVNIRDISDLSCKIIVYVLYLSKAFGAWLIVALSLERLTIITFPLKAKFYFTLKRAKTFVGVLLGNMSLVYTCYLVFCEVSEKDTIYPGCGIPEGDMHVAISMNIFNLVFYCVIPSVVILMSNGILYYTLKYKQKVKIKNYDSLGFTFILLVLSVSYIVLTLPVGIIVLHNAVIFPYFTSEVIARAVYVPDLVNNAIHFVLYCFSAPLFRNEMKKMFCNNCTVCKRNSVVPKIVISRPINP